MISKDLFVFSDRGKLFQSFTVLTAKVRPPSEMFLWKGHNKFKLQLGLQSLVGSALLGRFQVKGQRNCSTWSSSLGVG